MDANDFTERGTSDRHQFRFIVAPEDGAELSDMRAFTRELMDQVQSDLGTRLDWVAVDHFNTGHPHSHVVIRGKDDRGGDLIIAQDYITTGGAPPRRASRHPRARPGQRAGNLAQTRDRDHRQRLTRIDRAMIADLDASRALDLRPTQHQVRAEADTTLRLGRLKTLERMGLAQQVESGVWPLSKDIEPTLQALGERGDIIKAMSRALKRRGQSRSPEAMVIDAGGEASAPKIGWVIDKRLVDELDDRMGLIVDGVDGRVRHVEVDGDSAAGIPIGAVVETGARSTTRPADRTIAGLAEAGVYRPSDHQQRLENGELRLPPGANGGDLVEARVRRLEALRRAGVVERLTNDAWRIPEDFASRAEAFDAAQGRRAQVRLLSAFDLERQIGSDGATWLDRQLVAKRRTEPSPHGFGGEVHRALAGPPMRFERVAFVSGGATSALGPPLPLQRKNNRACAAGRRTPRRLPHHGQRQASQSGQVARTEVKKHTNIGVQILHTCAAKYLKILADRSSPSSARRTTCALHIACGSRYASAG